MKKNNILQINNEFIQDSIRKQQENEQENRRKNRFMGLILVLAVFLFILPTYNLVESYNKLQENEQQLADLNKQLEVLTEEQKIEASLVAKLEDEDYAAKYVRAKYQYSKDEEFIYNIPGLLPQ